MSTIDPPIQSKLAATRFGSFCCERVAAGSAPVLQG
jgi:hypothetical protein